MFIKIIDFEKKGNLLRLYLGEDDVDDYGGDDWNDYPYEHNAGTVYDRYVAATADFVMDFDGGFCEPADDWHFEGNSTFCKDDFKKGRAPCIMVAPPKVMEDYWSLEYTKVLGNKNALAIYYEQPYNKYFVKKMNDHGCTLVKETYCSETVKNE